MNVLSTLQWLESHEAQGTALLGFDAFIDRICRHASGLGGEKMLTMTDFGRRLIDRGENSGVVSVREIEKRLGGNMPNTANVLSELGAKVSCIGAFGLEKTDRVFAELEKKCRIISYADPGACLALEFENCKLFFGDNGELDDLTWPELKDRVGGERLVEEFAGARLIGLLNWGELSSTQRFWEGLLGDVLPKLEKAERDFFVDFSDMSGRTKQDIDLMLETLRKFRQYGRVIASVNQGELNCLDCGRILQENVADVLVLHTAWNATLMIGEDQWTIPTRFVENPVLLTGGGDSFNAGFCIGLLYGLPLEDCLKTANATSGCYVRYGRAPSMKDIMDEILVCEQLWK